MKKIVILLALLSTCCTLAQDNAIHPAKRVFKNSQNWQAIKPGQIALKNFHPFRAVYQRNYRQGAGPKAGESRTDRVILMADLVGWDGKQAILCNMIDSGEAHYDDTNGRSLATYFDASTMEAFLELGPVPGSSKDYFTLRLLEDKAVGTFVTTDKGEAKNQIIPITQTGFGAPVHWMLASMDLKKGQKIRFDPVYSAGLGALSPKAPCIIRGQKEIKGANGQTYQTWIVESISNMKSPWITHSHFTDKPPYLIRRIGINKNSGEERIYMDLLDFQAFKK